MYVLNLQQTLTVYYNPTPKNRYIQCHHKQCTLTIIFINIVALSGICKYTLLYTINYTSQSMSREFETEIQLVSWYKSQDKLCMGEV